MSQSDYCKYYEAQRVGEIPVFRGGSQRGSGIGDILRGLFRSVLPVALRGIQTFAGKTLDGALSGQSLGMAAKAAIMPTISSVAGSAGPTISRLVNSVIPGLVANATGTNTNQQSGRGVLFDGENGVPTTHKAIEQYKRSAPGGVAGAVAKQRKRGGKQRRIAETGGTHYNF
jgi:hypothetical protein